MKKVRHTSNRLPAKARTYTPVLNADTVFNHLMERFAGTENYSTTVPFSRSELMTSGLDRKTRDLNKECGYPFVDPTIKDYVELYERHDIAAAIVNAKPDACFRAGLEVYDTEKPKSTEFDSAFERLSEDEDTAPTHWLHKADRESGIGEFAILLLGMNDGKKLSEPAFGTGAQGRPSSTEDRKLLYMRVYGQRCVNIAKLETNPNTNRYNKPLLYDINFADPNIGISGTPAPAQKGELVHWTRVLHVAEDSGSSMVFGRPRLKQCYNRLLDLRKILGSSAEMFYKGGFPGLFFETFEKLAGDAKLDKASLTEEMAAYQAGLQRFLTTVGGTWKSLEVQVADPTNHVEMQLLMISATTGIPMRILVGSEAGHLASSQDAVTWNARIKERQGNYLEPRLIRPFVQRLVTLGLLPKPKNDRFRVYWPDLNSMTDKDRADVSLKTAQALLQYATSGMENMITFPDFMVQVLNYPVAVATEIFARAKAQAKSDMLTRDVWSPEAGNTLLTSGSDSSKSTGASGRKNAIGGALKPR